MEYANTERISTNLRTFETARNAFFEFWTPDAKDENWAKLVKPAKDDDLFVLGNDTQDRIRLSVTSCDIPSFTLGKHEIKRGNDKVTFAGVPEYKSGSLKLDDFVGLGTKSILYSWLQAAYDPRTLKGGRMYEYKFDCYLVEYTQDYTKLRKWRLHGCWLSALNEQAFDKDSDGPRKITATLEYDRAEIVEENKDEILLALN